MAANIRNKTDKCDYDVKIFLTKINYFSNHGFADLKITAWQLLLISLIICKFAYQLKNNQYNVQRISLSRNEKRLLCNRQAGVDYYPDGMSLEAVLHAALMLERHGLLRVLWVEGHTVVDCRLTNFGKAYMLANPHLRNPIDWRWVVTTAISIAALLVAIATLLTACRILQQ